MATTDVLRLNLLSSGLRQPEVPINANTNTVEAILTRGNASDTGIFQDLVAFWPLHELSGKRYDKAGSNNLTDNNTVTQGEGRRKPAAQFTAANSESLSIADNAAISTGNIDFEIRASVLLDAKATSQDLVTKYGAAGQIEYGLFYGSSSDRFVFAVSNNGTAVVSVNADALGSPSTATWYDIVVFHDSVNDVIGISVNNGTVNTTAHSTGVFNSTSGFYLGGRASSPEYFGGRMETVRFFKRVLTSTERTYFYNSGLGDPLWS